MKKKGFTLIELLLVIFIIAFLASMVVATLNIARRRSRDARRIANIGQMRIALQLYYDTVHAYPVTGTAAAAAALVPAYIASWPTDPITALEYTYFGAVRNPGKNGSNTCTTPGSCGFFHIGAAVEDPAVTAINTDADRCPTADGVCAASNGASTILADTSIYGTDGLDIGSDCTDTAAVGRGCYDQTP